MGNAQTTPAATAPASPAAPPHLLATTFGDWTWRCVASADGRAATGCEIGQSVKVNQGGKVIEILNLAVSRANDKAGKVEWALVALTPLDVHLPSEFALTVGGDADKDKAKGKNKDKPKPLLTQYRNCNQMGCFVVTPLDAAMISRLKQEQEAAAFFRLLNGKTVKVVFSLKGFDKAIEALASKDLPPPVVATAAPAPQPNPPAPAPAAPAK